MIWHPGGRDDLQRLVTCFTPSRLQSFFDKRTGFFWKGRKAPEEVFGGNSIGNATNLRDIHALQLVSSIGSRYSSYDLNLICFPCIDPRRRGRVAAARRRVRHRRQPVGWYRAANHHRQRPDRPRSSRAVELGRALAGLGSSDVPRATGATKWTGQAVADVPAGSLICARVAWQRNRARTAGWRGAVAGTCRPADACILFLYLYLA